MAKKELTRVSLQLAKGQSCIRCGINDGTIVICHYTGSRQSLYGKGWGVKCHHFFSADLCGKCHAEMDQYTELKNIARPSFWDKLNQDEQFEMMQILEDRAKLAHDEEFGHLALMTAFRDMGNRNLIYQKAPNGN